MLDSQAGKAIIMKRSALSTLVRAAQRNVGPRIGVGALLVMKAGEAPHRLNLFRGHALRHSICEHCKTSL